MQNSDFGTCCPVARVQYASWVVGRLVGRARALTLGCLCLLAGGCDRSPVDVPCPDATVGELVVTEIRGDQSGDDGYGEWFEIYNDSDRLLSLYGAVFTLTKLNGAATADIVVRRPLEIGPGAYATFGRVADDARPEHIDYGYLSDFDSAIYDGGALDINTCGERIDRVIYRDTPSKGTIGLDGAIAPPTAADNDIESAWCVDDREDAQSAELGIRGTPREGNMPCP